MTTPFFRSVVLMRPGYWTHVDPGSVFVGLY